MVRWQRLLTFQVIKALPSRVKSLNAIKRTSMARTVSKPLMDVAAPKAASVAMKKESMIAKVAPVVASENKKPSATTANRFKFDLKASLSKPLGYKPYTGLSQD